MKTFNGVTGKNDAKSHSFNTGNPISNTCGLIEEQHVVLPYLYFLELIQKVLLVQQVVSEERDTTCITGFPVSLRK